MSHRNYDLGQIDIPLEYIGVRDTIGLDEAMTTPLASAFGTEITGITGEAQFNDLLRKQAEFLLRDILSYEPDENALNNALRMTGNRYKNDELLWREDGETDTSARILFPYTPPIGSYLKIEEQRRKQSHMTFGIRRRRQAGPTPVRTARATVWLEDDNQSPFRESIRARRITGRVIDFAGLEPSEEYLNHTKRLWHSSVPLLRILGKIPEPAPAPTLPVGIRSGPVNILKVLGGL